MQDQMPPLSSLAYKYLSSTSYVLSTIPKAEAVSVSGLCRWDAVSLMTETINGSARRIAWQVKITGAVEQNRAGKGELLHEAEGRGGW